MSATSSTHPHEGKETSIIVNKFKNYFSAKKLPLIENLRIKFLTFFKRQFDKIAVILFADIGVLTIHQYFPAKPRYSVRTIF